MNTISLRLQKSITLIALFVSSFVTASFAGAQIPITPATPTTVASQTKVTTVATVNVQDIKLLSQKDNTFNISFRISNREGSQPKIIYAVDLLQKDEKMSFVLIDQKIYDNDVLSLNENDAIIKNVTYTAPAYLKGKYVIQAEAKNTDGLMLGLVQIREEVTLNGTDEYIQIDQPSCFITVEGEAGNKQYTLNQGVDITKDETLTAHCSVTNTFKTDQTVVPTFETRYRTTFGKLISTDKQDSVVFKAGQKTNFTAKLPKATEPQAYDAILTFMSQSNQELSSPVAFHYVLRGESATIQNITLDKDSYVKGEIAKVMFFWSGSADSFPESRLGITPNKEVTVLFTLTDNRGKECIAPYSKNLEAKKQSGVENLEIAITSDCRNPVIKASIVNSDKKVLASNSYEIVSKVQPIQIKKESPLIKLGYGIIGIAGVLLMLYLARKNRNAVTKTLLIGLMVLGGVMGGADIARAETFYVSSLGGTFSIVGGYQISAVTISLDKSEYTPGEIADAYAYAATLSCGNVNLVVKSVTIAKSTWRYNYPIMGGWFRSTLASLPVEKVAGSFYAIFKVEGLVANYFYVPYTVTVPAVAGTCGTANSHAFASTDTTWGSYTQCGNGTPSPTTFPAQGGTATWTCSGTNNGSVSTTCSASRASAPVAGKCDTTQYNTCLSGTFSNYPTNTAENYLWSCYGSGGGASVEDCSYPKPVNGVCSKTVPDKCASGNYDYSPADTDTKYLWTCRGLYDGTTIDTCSYSKPINGVCDTANHDTCTSGTYVATPADTTTDYNWTCKGLYNGTTIDTCSYPKAKKCTGTLPSNTEIYTGNDAVTVDTPYSYSSTDTATQCQYHCNTASVRNAANTACEIPSCQGIAPSAAAHTELYPNDNIGIPKTLPFPSYTYSSSNIQNIFCEYRCVSGYVRSGTTCIIDSDCGTASKTYLATISPEAFPSSDTFCTAGTSVPPTPSFPAKGATVTWTCGLKTCSASRGSDIKCGYKNNIPSLTKPKQKTATDKALCSNGSTPVITLDTAPTPDLWKWTCGTALCSAPKSTFSFWEF